MSYDDVDSDRAWMNFPAGTGDLSHQRLSAIQGLTLGVLTTGLLGLTAEGIQSSRWAASHKDLLLQGLRNRMFLRRLGIEPVDALLPLSNLVSLMMQESCHRESPRKQLDFRALLSAFEGYQGFQLSSLVPEHKGFASKWPGDDVVELSAGDVRLTLSDVDSDVMTAVVSVPGGSGAAGQGRP